VFKVKVLTIGKCREEWLGMALAEYEKRLQGKLSLEWRLAKDEAQLKALIEKEERYIALDPQGELLDSEGWSRKMARGQAALTFVIGGADGLGEEAIQKAQFVWSLSPLTFTHQMTRLILIEQLYRALEIEKGSRYHKS
jgi:23S rRNA (pseudouridine1915-N3)-methyltransferase